MKFSKNIRCEIPGYLRIYLGYVDLFRTVQIIETLKIIKIGEFWTRLAKYLQKIENKIAKMREC